LGGRAGGQVGRWLDGWEGRRTGGRAGRWADGQAGRRVGGQADRWADEQVDGWAGEQTGRWADRRVSRAGRWADGPVGGRWAYGQASGQVGVCVSGRVVRWAGDGIVPHGYRTIIGRSHARAGAACRRRAASFSPAAATHILTAGLTSASGACSIVALSFEPPISPLPLPSPSAALTSDSAVCRARIVHRVLCVR
jgi:hypothetical protein